MPPDTGRALSVRPGMEKGALRGIVGAIVRGGSATPAVGPA
jgi:hypothetical protein